MFKDKVVLVTGGSSGIGKATALTFARKGADVIITYKSNKSGAKEVTDQIKKMGRITLAIQVDLINEKETEKTAKTVIEKFGKIDILINNAGRYIDGDEWDGSSKVWLKSLQQNLISAMNMSKYIGQIFNKQKSGIIINIASRYATDGNFDAISYGASKAGIVNITQAYAKLLKFPCRCNAISPGAVKVGYWLKASKKELKAQGKLVKLEKVVSKIIFLCSDKAKNINGKNFSIMAE